MSDPAPQVTVIVPVHNNESTVAEVIRGVVDAVGTSGRTFEILAVDDASTDGSWAEIRTLAAGDDRIRGIRLARNVGGGTVRGAGCAHARGTYICTIDADLDYDPEDLVRVVESLESGNEFVSGVRTGAGRRPLARRIGTRVVRRVVSRTWSFRPRDIACGLQGWTADLVPGALPYLATDRDTAWAVPLFEPVRRYAEVEVAFDERDRPSSYGFARQVGRTALLGFTAWRGMATAMLGLGVAAGAVALVAAIASAIWWAVGGPVWPLVATAAIVVTVALPFVTCGLVISRIDRLTQAATPPYVVRSDTDDAVEDGS